MPTMLRPRDLAESAKAAPTATHLLIAHTPAGDACAFVDDWRVAREGLAGYYNDRLVLVVPLDSEWALIERAAYELVDAETAVVHAAETMRTLFEKAGLRRDEDEVLPGQYA